MRTGLFASADSASVDELWPIAVAILSWCGDSGMTTARVIVGAVVGVVSLLQTVDSPDVNVICISNDLRTLSCS